MSSARIFSRSSLPRAARRLQATPRRQLRFQSTSTASPAASSGSRSSHVAAGVAGGLVGVGVLSAYTYFTPAGKLQRKINSAAKEADQMYQEAAKKLQQSTPNADQAIDSIKQFAYTYVGWIPGGRAYVDTAFNDFETVRKNHRDEADQIVNDAYKQLQDVAKAGLSLAALTKAYEVLADVTKKFASLAGDAASDIIDNHPELKEKLGGNVDQLKQLGKRYGPEAQKQVDETWKQVKDIAAGGLGAGSLEKIRKLIADKVEQIKKLGDEAWEKGLEESEKLLDKNPKIKELVEKNADALKQGNAKEVFDKVKSAVESGDTGALEDYVKNASEKAKSKASELTGGATDNMSKYFDMIPQGSEIMPKLQQLREVAEKHKVEGEKLFKETMEELKQVIEKKSKKAQDIVDKAKKEAK